MPSSNPELILISMFQYRMLGRYLCTHKGGEKRGQFELSCSAVRESSRA